MMSSAACPLRSRSERPGGQRAEGENYLASLSLSLSLRQSERGRGESDAMRCNCIRPSASVPLNWKTRGGPLKKSSLAGSSSSITGPLLNRRVARCVRPSVRPYVRLPTADRPTAIDPISARNRNSPPPRVTRPTDRCTL